MDDQRRYLPPVHDNDAINALLNSVGLPSARKIVIPTIGGEYHRIYFLSLPDDGAASWLGQVSPPPASAYASGTVELVLRVASDLIPRIKTENEVAVIAWIAKNTSIPVPEVVRYDATSDNLLGHEFLLQMRCPGVTAGSIYDHLTPKQMDYILKQMHDFMLQLWRIPIGHIGGFRLSVNGQIEPGPCVEWECWQEGSIGKHWGPGESFETLNAIEPGYATFSEFAQARLVKNIRSLRIHDSMSWVDRQQIDRLEQIVSILRNPERQSRINDTSFRLAHRDLHFWNFVIDPTTCKITGVLDWEFAQCVPMPLANLSSSPFLNSCKRTDESRAECRRLVARWLEELKMTEEGAEMLQALVWKHPDQEALWDILNYTRCVIEVCPRGVQLDQAKGWWEKVTAAVAILLQ